MMIATLHYLFILTLGGSQGSSPFLRTKFRFCDQLPKVNNFCHRPGSDHFFGRWTGRGADGGDDGEFTPDYSEEYPAQ